jgi:hypothetical protein
MPYVARSYLDDPADLQVWRYMDIEKLLSILLDQALFFTSTRTIASDDWFEGQFTADELAALGLDPIVFKEIEEKYHATLLSQLFFNCWHMNNTESDAMWKIYVNGNGGVAIASTVARLKQSFRNSPEDISLGKITYAVGTHGDHVDHPVRRYMRKKPAFSHEQEARLIFFDQNKSHLGRPGVLIPVDVKVLIEQVVISPKAEAWFLSLTKNVVAKLGYDIKVVPSDGLR